MLVLKDNNIREERKKRTRLRRPQSHIHRLRNLPSLEDDSESLACKNHPGCVLTVVRQVQEDDGLHENIGQNGTDRGPNHVFLFAPVRLFKK